MWREQKFGKTRKVARAILANWKLFAEVKMALTSNVIQKIVCCTDPDNSPVDPIVQILGVKKLAGGDRYRLVLSDGVHYYTSSMLGTQLNDMVNPDMVEPKAVIQMNRYTCNVIQGTRKLIIVLELTVLRKASEVDGKIGEPEILSDLLENQAQMTVPVKKEPILHQVTNNNQPPKAYNNFSKNTNSNPYNNKSPIAPKASFYGSNTSQTSSKNVFPIASLTPYQNRWTIRARITNKAAIRHYSNSRGEGKLFSMDLVDESGEIRATGFNDAVDKYYDMLEAGKVYFITKATLKTANKQYTSLRNDYEMTLSNDTIIELCTEECDLPKLQFNFKCIKDIEQVNKDALVDVIGVVKSTTDVTQITTKATNKQVSKRDVTIVDQSGAAINATLWGGEAEKFEEYAEKNPVVAIKGAKVSDFGGRSLSILNSSIFHINPDVPEAHELKGWYDNGGVNEQTTSLSGQRMEGGIGGGQYKTVAQIKDENLGMGEKADYFNVRAYCVFSRKENCMYQACPGPDCNKKVTEDNGQFRCEKCDRTYPDFKYRMILSSNISDFSGNQWITSFQESAEAMLGVTAEQLGKYKDEDEAEFEKVFNEAAFKPFIFKIRAKMENYQDERRLKCSAVTAVPMNFKQESKRLLEEIKKLELS